MYKGRDVVGVWLKGAAQHLEVPSQAFSMAVKRSGLGHNQEKRSFLEEESEDTVITDHNSVRRSCSCGYLDQLPSDIAAGLRRG